MCLAHGPSLVYYKNQNKSFVVTFLPSLSSFCLNIYQIVIDFPLQQTIPTTQTNKDDIYVI